MSKSKPWSKKKKIIVAVICALAFLLVAAVCGGMYALNWYCDPGEYTVSSAGDIATPDIKIIAHRGFRAVAPENTAPSFEEAGKAGFWANECDIYRTSDGVWVVQHDRITYRMMDITKDIEKCTYEELMSHRTDNGVNIDNYPDLKICSLEEYMDICQKYNMNAVIELKGESNQEHYQEIIDMINKYPTVKVVFISFQFSDLQALRKLCDNDLMYLVQEIKDEDIDLALTLDNCGINFNGNKEANLADNGAMIKKCQEKGLATAAWTIDDVNVMKALVDCGVEFITTDCITY